MTLMAEDKSTGGDEQLTIDQLAQRTGMTVRNIRAHQSRGLLPPPSVRARTGYYGADHLARIKLIQEMQAEGYNLKAIERLVHGATGAVEEALGFKRALLAPFGDEQPEYLTQEELDERFKGPFEDKVLRKAPEAPVAAPARRRALRGAEPHAAAGRRGAGQPGRGNRPRARRRRAGAAPLARGRPVVRAGVRG